MVLCIFSIFLVSNTVIVLGQPAGTTFDRVPITNLRITDKSGNTIDAIDEGKQVLIEVTIMNMQDEKQSYALSFQTRDQDGLTKNLSWLEGKLTPHQTITTGTSWIPSEAGEYTITVFNWESVDNPDALSDPVSKILTVKDDEIIRDRDGDGIIDKKDNCPEFKEDPDGIEDWDGCPEEDADNDGIIDANDSCPTVPEDPDGIEDWNGCPEENPQPPDNGSQIPPEVIIFSSIAAGGAAGGYFGIKKFITKPPNGGNKAPIKSTHEPTTSGNVWIEVDGDFEVD